MKDFMSFAGGALIGAALGVGVVMFTAPKSGPETRSGIKSRFQDLIEVARSASRQREQELWAEFDIRVRAPASLPAESKAFAAPESTALSRTSDA